MADELNLEEMDDEEFEKAQTLLDEQVETPSEPEETQDNSEPEQAPAEEAEPETEEEPELELEEPVSEETEDTDDTEEVNNPESDDTQDIEPEEETEDDESPETDTESTEEFNYRGSYEELMKPIKVSGKDIEIKSAEDLRSLASMGIDYSRKMRDIKPLRAVGETLANAGIITNGVVDEQALTRLLDISQGNKDAIASLLAEQNIDPMDMETENVEYTPEAAMVSQESIALQDVEAALTKSGGIEGVVTALGRMDDVSKNFFNDSPQNLLKLNDDIQSGAFDEIMGAIEYEKSLGRLGNMSDMEAYVNIAQQKTVPAAQKPVQETQTPPAQPKPSTAKRKAAGISKRGPVKKQQKTYDYINMSDEEFEKLIPDTGFY